MAKIKFQTPSGMHDVLPQDQIYFQKIYKTIEKTFDFYGFEKIDTPILENADLFSRSVGVNTDIVEKEMYILRTKEGKDALALRPEGTAPIMRAYLEHGLNTYPQPIKLWYHGPFFRHERPQAGRYRQFWQYGFEVLGDKESVVDAQTILIAFNILNDLGINNISIRINSIGDENCRGEYRKALVKFLKSKKNSLCRDCLRRSKTNPLRVLDCKNEKCREILNEAPQIIDYLCDDCKTHLKSVLEYLEELKIPFTLDPFLVRGLDYYTRTVFEIEVPFGEEGEGGVLAGGGRYDILSKVLGKTNVPSCGAAAGIERIVSVMRARKLEGVYASLPKVFISQIGPLAKKKGLVIFEELRKAGIKATELFSKDSLKAQLSKANRLNINTVIIIGQKEALKDMVIIRDMETGKQSEVSIKEMVKEVKTRLK
jgi:histidyl-tRNA synthetase